MTAITTFVFYDTFQGDIESFVKPLRDAATEDHLSIVVDDMTQWSSWFEVASCLWPVISEMKGGLLVTLQHCCGTNNFPSAEVLKFVTKRWLSETSFESAPFKIIEARTLGGAIVKGQIIPTGNFHNEFFVDLILVYDAEGVSNEDRQLIVDNTSSLLKAARSVDSLVVDFSGTHSQPDDSDYSVSGSEILGSESAYETIMAVKRRVDPSNRFRFHPLASLLE